MVKRERRDVVYLPRFSNAPLQAIQPSVKEEARELTRRISRLGIDKYR